MRFEINGVQWKIEFVPAGSPFLRRSDGSVTLGMCDADKCSVYLLKSLRGAYMRRVLAHELVHCFMFSYSIDISLEEEEFIADWVATYGSDLVYLLDDILRMILKGAA